MLLVLDNYDSFTYNLVQYLGELRAEPRVVRNDRISVDSAIELAPRAIVVSPGPCTPAEAGISVALIRAAAHRGIPVLGVCLGHQAVAEAFGGAVVRATRPMHGKSSEVRHSGAGLFDGVDSPIDVMRYHSLIVDPAQLPAELEVTATSSDAAGRLEIMALSHRDKPVWGVQFHPESIGTPVGRRILENFLTLASSVGVA